MGYKEPTRVSQYSFAWKEGKAAGAMWFSLVILRCVGGFLFSGLQVHMQRWVICDALCFVNEVSVLASSRTRAVYSPCFA